MNRNISSAKLKRSQKRTDPVTRVRDEWTPYHVSKLELPVFRFLPKIFYRVRWAFASIALFRLPGVTMSLGRLTFLIGILALIAFACYSTWDDTRGSGYVVTFVLIPVYILSMRNSFFTFLLGISFERILFWHKLCARLTIVVTIYHAWVSQRYDVTGGSLLGIMGLLSLFSFVPVRRHLFEIFYRMHWVLVIALVVVAFFHNAGIVLIGIGFWVLDLGCRAFVVVRNRKNAARVKCSNLPADVVRLSWKKDDFKYKSGQYVFVCIPALSLFEWHPFSISSSPYQEEVSIHVRVLGNWTKRLQDLVAKKKRKGEADLNAFVEGPYGTLTVNVDSDKYTHFLLISGGIGITPMQSICNDLLMQHENGRPLNRVHFIWSVRDRFMVSAVTDDNKPYVSGESGVATAPHSFSPDLVERSAAHILEAKYYLTQCRKKTEFADANIRPDVQPFLKFGRPDLDNIFIRARNHAASENVAVLVCGPPSLVSDVASMCQTHSQMGTFHFHKEVFDF